MTDSDDLVQKGYGWALKEASNHYPKKVFDFVMRKKTLMPRTALRYAIEKMPPNWKKLAMK
jgi:3-methyladenine DNA glycosylase AlkD